LFVGAFATLPVPLTSELPLYRGAGLARPQGRIWRNADIHLPSSDTRQFVSLLASATD
jgi:hypothetical protein